MINKKWFLAVLNLSLVGFLWPATAFAVAPTLSATKVWFNGNISYTKDTTARLGATIDTDGGQMITERGIVWSTSDTTPTIPEGGTKVAGTGTAVGVFSVNITGLTKASQVYFCGYAINAGGTSYSPVGNFWTEPDAAVAPTVTAPSGTNYFDLTVTYTKPGNADGVLVVVRQGSAPIKAPYDGTLYTADSRLGQGDPTVPSFREYVVANSPVSGSVTVTGLLDDTNFYFAVYAYKGSGTGPSGINYVQTITSSIPEATDPVPLAGRSHNELWVAADSLKDGVDWATETPADCTNCHNRHHTSQPLLPTGLDMYNKCFVCHQAGGAADPKINIGLHLADGSVDCGTCHSMHSFRKEELYSKNHAGVWGFNKSFIRANMSKYMNPAKYPPPAGGGTTTALDNTVFQDRATDFAFASTDPDPVTGKFNGVCQTCHTLADHHKQTVTDNHNIGVDCATCHAHQQTDQYNAFQGGGHTDSQFGWSGNCDKCHSATPGSPTEAVVRVIHSNNCDLCHTTGGPYNAGTNKVGANGDGDATLAEGDAGTWASTCLTCHNNGTTIFTGGIHHNTVSAANNNCTACHDGTKLVQNHSSTVATQATCVATQCHTVGTVGTATTISVDPADGLKHKACQSCHDFDVNLSGKLRTAPGTKGVNNLPNGGDDSIVDATPNGGGSCIICHNADGTTAGRVAFHHQNTNTSAGNCDYCHYDHRPDTGYSTANINAATGLDNAGGNTPTHLPCEECHVKYEDWTDHAPLTFSTSNVRVAGYNGTSMTVVAWNKGSNTAKTATRWTTSYAKTDVHVIPNTQNQIDNWGICITCHDGTATVITGVTAAQLQPYHALPTTIDNRTANYCGRTTYNSTHGRAQYLAGKTAYNQISNMNYYGDDWRPTGTAVNGDTHRVLGGTWTSNNTNTCGRTITTGERRTNQYNAHSKANGKTWLGTLSSTVTEKLIPNPWTGTQANNPFANIRDQLPIFAAQTPATDQPPAADRISVTSAVMNGANLDVVATVTNGSCTDLRLVTGAGTVNFNASCQAFIGYSYPANGRSINVTSIQESIDVMYYPITP